MTTTNPAEGGPLDTCVCGDYRRDHPNNGPCKFNHQGFDLTHAGQDCHQFTLAQREKPND